MSHDQARQNYADLVTKTDTKFAEIESRQRPHMQCGQGCYQCCAPGLTVSPIEADNIAAHLQANPKVSAECVANEAANPFNDQHCSFLSPQGHCLIYEVRPLVCRSHGVPLRYPEADPNTIEAGEEVSVCSLNFTTMSVADVPDEDVINLKLLYTLLGLINAQYDSSRSERRYLLTPSRLLELT